MIDVRNLKKRYGSLTAVDDISFHIDQGELCGFLGPNGAGKTSTMRILTGFMPPTDGVVTVAGYDVYDKRLEVKKRTGYLPESNPVYTDMRVAEYLDFVAEVKGLRGSAKRRQVAEVMEDTALTQRQRSVINRLSKGYRQRVGLAQALLNDPQILVLDEPSIGLDPMQITQIRSLIKNLAGKRTVILSTHILPEAQMICSRVMIINKGKLVADDTPQGLAKRMERAGRITAKVQGPIDNVTSAFRAIAGVENLTVEKQNEPDTALYNFDPAAGSNPRKEMTRLTVANDWELIELSQTSYSLEQIYMKIVAEENIGREPMQ